MNSSYCRSGFYLFLSLAGISVPALAAASAPSMSFMALAAVAEHGSPQPSLAWSRQGTTLIVVAKTAAQCGQRASDPSFQIAGGMLRIGYGLPEAADVERKCVATQIFTFKNLPDAELQVATDTHTEPVQVAKTPSQMPAPPMTFVSVPAASVGSLDQGWQYQHQHGDKILVIAREPAECGQRPVDPQIEVQEGKVSVGYSLPITLRPDVVQDCATTAIITVNSSSQHADSTVLLETRLKAIPIAEPEPPETSVAMSFMGVPAFQSNSPGEQWIFHQKVSDQAVVVVRDRANCGDRPASPTFTYRDGLLRLQYALPAIGDSSNGRTACASAAIFTFRNLSGGELRVAASATRGEIRSISLLVQPKQANSGAALPLQAMSSR